MVVMVLRQNFQLMNCEGSEALETSSSLAVKVSVFSWSSPCSAIMAGESAMFLLRMKNFNVLHTYCSRAYSICDK